MLGRRAWMVGATAAAACSRLDAASGGGPPPTPPSSANVRLLTWDLGQEPWGRGRAVVVVPTWGGAAARHPVLIALHGRGEALKAPAEGALGWARDYGLIRAFDRVLAPPLDEADYNGFVDPARLARTNASLAARPFSGLIVACPWLPDFHPVATADLSSYSRFIKETLLPRVRRETPALSTPEATGIDGVSLGGVVALRIGLTAPQSFGAVGGIQPAIAEGQDADWAALARAARAQRPGLRLRLLTSGEDYFRNAITSVSRTWRAAGIDHDFDELPGPHDYVFNRGPGSIELLLWHDRSLSHV
jgi:iron(III)-salmochelin esterase